jgi:hypothetical protein
VGLPGAWTVLFLRAVVVHPAGRNPPALLLRRAAIAFEQSNALGTRNGIVFVAAFPTAHTLARLRIAGCVTATVARFATGSGGPPLAGRGSHPLDDKPNFMRLSHLSLLSDQPCLVALAYSSRSMSLHSAWASDASSMTHNLSPLSPSVSSVPLWFNSFSPSAQILSSLRPTR